MVKKIQVLSRHSFTQVVDDLLHSTPGSIQPWYGISIHGTDEDTLLPDGMVKALSKAGLAASLSLQFDDIDKPYESMPEFKVFDDEQAHLLVGFLRLINIGVDGPLILHCHAGISRSGAVGLFACRYYGLDEERFMRRNPSVYPNRHVLSKLNEEAQKRKEGELECQNLIVK